MLQGIARRLRLEPRELKDALWLGTALFSITCSYTLIKTARDSLYLSQLPARHLPYVYLGVGFLTLGISAVFARLTRKLSPVQALTWTALISAGVLVAFASAFGVKRLWIPAGFYVWVNVYGLILVSQFWAFTAGIADPREAKRIFGIVGGGGILGGLVGGLLAGQVGQRAGLASLTIVGAAIVASLAPVVLFGLRHRHAMAEETTEQDPVKQVATWRHPYVRWLAIMVLCSVVVTGLLDYQLKLQVQQRYPSEQQLAAFFGLFYTVINVVALVLQLVGTRLFLQRLGAGFSALVLPGGLAIGLAATLAAPGFLAVLATRLWDQVARFSVHKSALELFYFPLEPGLRRRAKAIIEAGIERFGDGLAGILILAVGVSFRENIPRLAAMSTVLVLAWLVAWFQVRRHYVRELGRSLRRANLDREQRSVSLRELSVLKEMVRLLESPYERVVLNGIDMLAETAPKLLQNRIVKLLAHPSPRVRTRALLLAGAHQDDEARQRIAALVKDPDPLVRVEALRVLLSLGRGKPVQALEEFLSNEDPRVRATALRCFLEFAPASEEGRVRKLIEKLLAEGSPAERLAAAEAIGHRPEPSLLHELLPALYQDPDLEVRRAAMRSAGLARRRDDVPILIRALASADTMEAAQDGLIGYGDRVIGTLGDYMIDSSVPIEIRRLVPKVLGEIPSQSSVDTLFRVREVSDVVLVYRVLKAMNQLRAGAPELKFPLDLVNQDLDHDLRSHLTARMHQRALTRRSRSPRSEAERFLVTVLKERSDQALNRVFRRLALLYLPRYVFAAYRGIMSDDARARGNALEYLENQLSPAHREMVIPLLETMDEKEAAEMAEKRFGLRMRSPRESLAELLGVDDSWLRTVALHVAAVRQEKSLLALVEHALDAADARVRETAEWARRVLTNEEVPWPTR